MQDRAVQSFCLAPTEQLRPDRQALRSAVDSTLSDYGSHGERAHTPAQCTPIHVDCLVTAGAPNGLICIGQRLGALIPGVMARRELP